MRRSQEPIIVILLLSLLFLTQNVAAQTLDQIKEKIRDSVRKTDQLSENLKTTVITEQNWKKGKFTIEDANFRIDKSATVSRKFTYLKRDKKVQFLSVHYFSGEFSAEEIFYFRNDKLIYVTEMHFYKSASETNSVWSGAFYFRDGKLLDYVTNGHGKSESADLQPERQLLRMTAERLRQLRQILVKKNRKY